MRHRSQMPTAASTLIKARLTVANMINMPLKMPACATMKPERRNLVKIQMNRCGAKCEGGEVGTKAQ